MSIIDFSNFERQGNIENDIQLSSANDIRDAIIETSTTTLKSIKIFTPDMEHLLYNNDEFRSSLLKFARGNRHAQIQILVEDLTSALQNGHRLVQLSQQLTSAMRIKKTPEDYLHTNISFILFDQSRFIFKPDSANQTAIFSNCKHRTNKLLELFTPAWEQAEQDVHTRRFTI